jgi:hypothetical protein
MKGRYGWKSQLPGSYFVEVFCMELLTESVKHLMGDIETSIYGPVQDRLFYARFFQTVFCEAVDITHLCSYVIWGFLWSSVAWK